VGATQTSFSDYRGSAQGQGWRRKVENRCGRSFSVSSHVIGCPFIYLWTAERLTNPWCQCFDRELCAWQCCYYRTQERTFLVMGAFIQIVGPQEYIFYLHPAQPWALASAVRFHFVFQLCSFTQLGVIFCRTHSLLPIGNVRGQGIILLNSKIKKRQKFGSPPQKWRATHCFLSPAFTSLCIYVHVTN
jgi:hypothetical protein